MVARLVTVCILSYQSGNIYRYRLALQGRICHEQRIELTDECVTATHEFHQTIYIITPEYTSGSQIILRDNLAPMVRGKHVLILSASITTGYTVQAAIEAVNYYGGTVAGLSAIFATTHECLGIPVTSIFDPSSLPDYASFDSRDCPMCKAGQPIDALVNSFGYSAL